MDNGRPYWQSLGLSTNPFVDNGQHTCCSIPEWQHEIELLQHMVQFSHVMITVTGKPGAGKSTFAEQCIHRIGEQVEIIRLNADSSIDSMKILQQMTDALHLPDVNKMDERLKDKFTRQIYQLQKNQRNCLMVIENAHRLPQLTLSTLIDLAKMQARGEENVALHFMLISEPSLMTSMIALKADQRYADKDLIYQVELKPWSTNQINQYLEFRLNIAGFTDVMPFSEADVEKIKKLSQGIAADINKHASIVLQENINMQQQTKVSLWQAYRKTIIVSGTIAASIAVAASIVVKVQAPLQPNNSLQTAVVELAMPQNLAYIHSKAVAEEVILLEDEVIEQHKVVKQAENKLIDVPMTIFNQEPTDVEQKQALQQVRQGYSKLEKAPVVLDKVVVIPNIQSKTMTANAQTKKYGLQILATRTEASIQPFIEKHKLSGKVSHFTIKQNDKEWHVLLLGEYDSADQARTVISILPTDVQQLKPWPRSYESVISTS